MTTLIETYTALYAQYILEQLQAWLTGVMV